MAGFMQTFMNMRMYKMLTLLFWAFLVLPLQAPALAAGKILCGSLSAPIKIEVFSDFECPSCRELYLDVMRRIIVEYGAQNKVCLIYHEFPLTSIHPYSMAAARIAEAASRLGREKQLKVFDALFMDQAQWSQDGNLEACLNKALSRAEMQKMSTILRDPGINATIEKEIELGQQKQIRSTPTFFIFAKGKEQRVEGRVTYIALKQFIDLSLR
jgi:protein-disulfide isomerase